MNFFKKHKKNIIIGIIILVIIVVIYKRRNPKPEGSQSSGGGVSGSSFNLKEPCDARTLLKKWDSGKCVKNTQLQINKVYSKIGIPKLTEDGLFGSKTEKAFTKLIGKGSGTYAEIVAEVNKIK